MCTTTAPVGRPARSVVLVAGEVGKTVLLRVLVEPGVGEDVAAVGGCATR